MEEIKVRLKPSTEVREDFRGESMILELGPGRNPKYSGAAVTYLDKTEYPGLSRFVRHDLEQMPLPFPSETFDLIYASHVLEHIVRLPELLDELHRIITPSGILEVVTPHRDEELRAPYAEHVRFFTKESFRRLENSPYVQRWRVVDTRTVYYWKSVLTNSYKKGRYIRSPSLRVVAALAISVVKSPHLWQKCELHVKLAPVYDEKVKASVTDNP